MSTRTLLLGLGCWTAAALVGHADPAAAAAPFAALARPVALPFLWRSLGDAAKAGTPAEAFAKAQLVLQAIPGWADGYMVFAYRYAIDGDDQALPAEAHARAAADRLRVGLAVLDAARQSCPRHEIDLLVSMSWLVELAVRQEPAMASLLGEDPTLLADRFLATAEGLGAGRMVREQRLFQVPRLCAAMLRAGDRDRALALLDEGIRRCAEMADAALGAEWQKTLADVRRCLLGDPTVDRASLLADSRLESLATFLR